MCRRRADTRAGEHRRVVPSNPRRGALRASCRGVRADKRRGCRVVAGGDRRGGEGLRSHLRGPQVGGGRRPGAQGRRIARPSGREARSSPQRLLLRTMSSSSPPSAKRGSAPARFWNGIACDGRSNWSSNVSSLWRSWATCPSTTTRAPAPGFTENSLWRCWWTSWSVTPVPFPPGDTTWRRRRPHSPWREFRFVLNQVRRAIEPPLGLTRTINEWNDISKALSEPPRRRRLQRAFHFNQ